MTGVNSNLSGDTADSTVYMRQTAQSINFSIRWPHRNSESLLSPVITRQQKVKRRKIEFYV